MRERASIYRPRANAGFSLIEMLIAALLMALIALGLIPLFMRAVRDNEMGNDYSSGSNGSKSGLEVAAQVDMHSELLQVPVGATEGVVRDSWTKGDPNQIGDASEGIWWPGIPTDKGQILWGRETTTHEYSMGDLDALKKDFTLTPDERQTGTGATPSTFSQLKEVEVIMDSESSSIILGGGRRVAFRSLKGF